MRVKVQNEIALERDMGSRAIINTDIDAYNKYMARKQAKEEEKRELDNLKNEVRELKEMVQNLLGNIKK